MGLNELKEAADTAIEKINSFIKENGNSGPLQSILNQMIFVRDNAAKGQHPADVLKEDEKFSYSIIASREFASPDEMELKEFITRVSRIMDRMRNE